MIFFHISNFSSCFSLFARAVDDMVKRLRKKLKDQKSTVKIETVWGYGFRLTSGGEA